MAGEDRKPSAPRRSQPPTSQRQAPSRSSRRYVNFKVSGFSYLRIRKYAPGRTDYTAPQRRHQCRFTHQLFPVYDNTPDSNLYTHNGTTPSKGYKSKKGTPVSPLPLERRANISPFAQERRTKVFPVREYASGRISRPSVPAQSGGRRGQNATNSQY